MSAKVIALQIGAGIQRDGTQFASATYIDGKWVRFQYGKPRKISGYNGAFLNASGISRGMIMSAENGINYVISGYSDGLEQWTTDNDNAVGFGPVAINPIGSILTVQITNQGSVYTNGTYTNVPINAATGSGAKATVTVSSNLVFSVVITTGGSGYLHNESITINSADIGGTGSGFAGYVSALTIFNPNANTLWQMDIGYDTTGNAQNNLIAHPGQNLGLIDNSVETRPLIGPFTSTTMTALGVFDYSAITTNGLPSLTITTNNAAIGAGVAVSGTGIPSGTYVVSSNTSSDILSSVAVTSTGGAFSCAATSGLFVGQTISISGSLGNITLSGVTVTGTSGTFSCTATSGLYTGQTVIVGGSSTPYTLSSVAITGASGSFSCTSTVGLAVNQPVYVSGTFPTTTLASVTVTNNSGAFSCTATTGLYVGMPVAVTGTQALATLASVAVTGTAGQCSCTATNGLYIGQPVIVSGTLTGTETGVNANQIYYIIATNGTSTFTLSGALNGSAITTTAGTTTGLTFQAPIVSGVYSGQTYYIIATNGTSTFTLSDTQNGPAINTIITSLSGLNFVGSLGTGLIPGNIYYISATNGTSTFSLSDVKNGSSITGTYGSTTGLTFQTVQYAGVDAGTTYYITATNGTSTFTLSATSGGSAISTVVAPLTGLTFTAPKSIGITLNTDYYIIATNNATTFTLSATPGGSAVTTVVNSSTTGLIFSTGSYQKVVMSNNATATGIVTLNFDNEISVSGGVVMLHPYLFVYGNYGLIKNSSAGNFNDWSSPDSNETSVASGKVVKGLALRGGTTSPAGLFWTLDSVVRVTYAPSIVNGVNFYWKYDLITQQSSILSSSCVIEYDGIFYWVGTDRFLMYNGVVQEVENRQNNNYFFDNLNYAQRQKVWVSKVPRWGEIWWFFPSGDSTECNDAIIYNVREKTWYDAGQAVGARRSAGVFSEVFRRPIWGGNDENTAGGYTLWQHEIGTNEIYTNHVNAIESYVETNVIGSSIGLVGTTSQPGDNVWTRLERFEPDFVQVGEMNLTVTGKSYADDSDDPSDPYPFNPDTLKIDMKEQRREMRLRFSSNTQNGDYFMGRVLLSIDTGDVRGTGNP
jgi:hypothetical protein